MLGRVHNLVESEHQNELQACTFVVGACLFTKFCILPSPIGLAMLLKPVSAGQTSKPVVPPWLSYSFPQ